MPTTTSAVAGSGGPPIPPPRQQGPRGRMWCTDECVFCGNRPTTVEDVWPKWIGRYLGRRPTRTITGGTRVPISTPFKSLSNLAKAQCVCRACNTTWMSQIEKRTSKLIKVMFNETIALQLGGASDGSQYRVAQWAMKTALMLQYVHPDDCIPAAVFREFYATRQPPQECVIFLARHHVQRTATGAHSLAWSLNVGSATGSEERIRGDMYGVTYFIQNVILQVIGYRLPVRGTPDLVFPQAFAPYVQRLWPIGISVDWPPSLRMNDAQLVAFGRSLEAIQRGRQGVTTGR